ncbi:nucleotidyltransferase family protein [Paenibacillus thailandensis]|uniref:Nucleotidyltransferase family protein n=1 Tax=Paenibacillus thailandensis TaxID=393250 RepID=A0ABW5R0R2_9BACL
MNKAVNIDVSRLSGEMAFLLLLLQDAASLDEETARGYASALDWNAFVELALHHRVYPAVYLKLNSLASIVPADTMETLRYHHHSNTFKMLELTKEMSRISGALAEDGIRSIQLKGPVLAIQLYGDLSLRTSKDLDILVDPDDVELAEATMARLGYEAADKHDSDPNWKRKYHHLSFSHKERRAEVEIHWRLNPNPVDKHTFPQLWERRETVPVAGLSFYSLGKEDLLYYLTDHGARHAWFRLRWLVDIARLVPHIRAEETDRYFKKHGGRVFAGQAFLLASALLRADIPGALLQMTTGRKAVRLAQDAMFFISKIVKLNPVPEKSAVWPYLKYTLSLMKPKQKWLYLLKHLEPNIEDRQQLPLSKPFHFLYFPLRPFLWLWRHIIN